MNRNTFKILTATTLIAPGAAAGATTALADSNQGDKAEVQAFQAAKGSITDAIKAAEQNTGGKAMSAEFDNEDMAAGLYDVEIAMADGTTRTVAVNPADGSVTACAALVGVMTLLNLLAVRKLLSVNSTITWWKIAVPLLTVVVLIISSTHRGVWSADPNPAHFDGIFTALPAAGIVFSYLGFRTAIDLGGETANPGRSMPIAVIGSVVLSAFVYILLQVAFLMALSPDDMANGWANLTFTGAAGPFAGLAASLSIGWLATLLYVDAFVSPGGTGLMYATGGSRILFGVGEMGAGPKWLMWLNSAEVPWRAVAAMRIVGVLFLLPFPAWRLLVG